MKKIILNIFKIICLIGCLFQIYQISAIYLSYETTTLVRYENEPKISLPAITVCSDKQNFLKFDYIRKINRNSTKLNENQLIRILRKLNKLTIKEQFKVLLSAEEISEIIGCYVLRNKPINNTYLGTYHECKNLSPIKISISFDKYCFTLFSQLREESDDRFLIDFDISTRLGFVNLISFDYNFENLDFVYYLHSRTESIIDEFRPYPVYVESRPFGMSLVYFHKTRVELLPKPFATSCFDYKTIGYHSRYDCIFKCKADIIIRNYSHWSGYSFTDKQEIDLFFKFNNIYEIDKKLSENCRKFCGESNDCLTDVFESYQLNVPIAKSAEVFEIRVSPSTKPNLLLKHFPKIQMQEYICYIASIISLWFGFSITMLSDFCLFGIEEINKISNYFNNTVFISKNKTINYNANQMR
jgi:hypothetical protein